MARPPSIDEELDDVQLVLNVKSVGLTDDQFAELCSENSDVNFEMTAQGELLILSPTYSETGWRNSKITQRLANWADADGTGLCFDSSALFNLPNGAKRAPDAAWISKRRWSLVPADRRKKFAPICPDFVIELRSGSDRLQRIRAKMDEYISNGTQLGWLLDTIANRAYIYRPGCAVEEIESPGILRGDPVLPDFEFNFSGILHLPE